MIVGDANMSEVATYLKVGTTAIVLAMIEDDELGDDWLLGNPVGGDPPGQPRPDAARTVMLRDGRRATALEVQWGLLERARKYERRTGCRRRRGASAPTCSTAGSGCSPGSKHDPDSVADWVDWVAKQRLVDGYADRHGARPGDAKLKAIDLQYHDLRADRCLARRAGLETLVDRGRGDGGDDRAADHDPGLLPRPLPRRSRPTTSSPPTGTRWSSTSAAIRCGGCR